MNLLKLFLENGMSVTTDTRKINKGDIYFGLKGVNFNGNSFAETALEKGASYSIVDEEINSNNIKIIKVESVLSSLQELAREYRRYLNIPVLALTGSNGKTTTKELLAAVLKNKFNINYTKGNLNNEIGVPLTILSTKIENDFLLIEMGANHQGEINALCEIAEPNFGLITNIGKAHLEGFGGIEGVKKGKSEIYKYLKFTKGKVFINLEDEILISLLPENINFITYNSQDLNILEKDLFLNIDYKGKKVNTNLYGEYNLNNIAVAIAIGNYFDIEEDKILKSISDYIPSNNRSQVINWNGLEIILDAYNANPSSIEISIKSFLENSPENKIVIIGDMFELGEFAGEEHKKILDLVLELNPNKAIFIGKNFYQYIDNRRAIFFETTDEAKDKINFTVMGGKSILIKGSRGMALEKLIL